MGDQILGVGLDLQNWCALVSSSQIRANRFAVEAVGEIWGLGENGGAPNSADPIPH